MSYTKKVEWHAEDFIADESFVDYHLSREKNAVEYWSKWLESHPEHLESANEARALLDVMLTQITDKELASEKAKIIIPQLPANRRRKIQIWIGSAAATILLLFGTWMFFEPLKKQIVLTDKIVYSTVTTEMGQRRQLTLMDGSKITLAGGSTLRYPDKIKNDTLHVQLSGDAHFEVAKNRNRVFAVASKNIKIDVLGTEFLIEQQTDNILTVALLEGKIKMYSISNANPSTLIPGQMAHAEMDGKIRLTDFNPTRINNIETKTLVFQDASFETVADKLQRYYGVTLKLKEKVRPWSFYGRFENESIETVIKTICAAQGIEYDMADKITYILYKP